MLRIENLRFKHPGQSEGYDFSMTAERSTITAISGRSGSGKSTLLDLMAGFLLPDSGIISWDQKNLIPLPPDKRPVTTLFQSNNLFDHRNAIDNVVVGINPAIPKTGPDVDTARRTLDSVGLTDYYYKRVSKLSGGQQQRVAIARALIRQRGIVLLDEPFSALDQQTRDEMLTLVNGLATNQKYTVIMVTHDLSDAKAIADVHLEIIDGNLFIQ